METLRRFENWAAPFVIVGALALLIWIAVKAGGFGPLLDQPSKLGWGADFWPVFFPALMGMIALLVDAVAEHPRLHPLRRGPARPGLGPVAGPADHDDRSSRCSSVLVTSGSQASTATAIWDPVELAAKTDNVFGLLFALVTVLVATISVNIAANVVSPGVRPGQPRAPAHQLPHRAR